MAAGHSLSSKACESEKRVAATSFSLHDAHFPDPSPPCVLKFPCRTKRGGDCRVPTTASAPCERLATEPRCGAKTPRALTNSQPRFTSAIEACDGEAPVSVRSEVNSELNFSPNFEGLVLGCIDADFCK